MVLNLAKWAYNLGVKQERTRIASELRVRSTTYRSEYHTYLDAVNNGDHSKTDKTKMKRRAEVAQEIELIINSLSDGETHVTSSFLFPNDNIDKELNK